jgi:hypothetical protein
MSDKKAILNIGAGKLGIEEFNSPIASFVVHLDRSYENGLCHLISDIEEAYLNNMNTETSAEVDVCYAAYDLFEFMDSYKFKFNHIRADRIFEHQFYDNGEIGRLLDACNQITTDDATMEIIVPNHFTLAEKLVAAENAYSFNDLKDYSHSEYNAFILQQCTEWMNTRCDPHGSVWTPAIAHHYINSEGGTWKIDKIDEEVKLKGRPNYMRIHCSKPS